MPIITKEPVTPTLIENTTMVLGYADGIARGYEITPNAGYVLHDNTLDWTDTDPETFEEVFKLGFARGTKTCGVNYDFEANPREFYAVPETEIPGDQIFGGVNNDHEIA
jgi:hypothetical protein